MLGWEDPVTDIHNDWTEHGDVKPQRKFILQELVPLFWLAGQIYSLRQLYGQHVLSM
jgi:hypothetical protein